MAPLLIPESFVTTKKIMGPVYFHTISTNDVNTLSILYGK